MKKFLIVIILALVTVSAKSQDSYIGFSLGTSIPQGKFAQNVDIFNDGYAIPGFTVSFEGFYYPISLVGVGGTLGFGSVYAERDVYLGHLLDYIETQTVVPVLSQVPLPEETNFESGFWNYVNLMLGPELSVPFGPFQAGVRALGGLNMSFYPKRDLSYTEGLDDIMAIAKGTSANLVYSYGGSILYQSRSGTGIKLSADYFNSSAAYDFELTKITDLETYKDTREEEVEMEAISVTLGFFYVF
ncbi:MAG: hypothetical protein K9J25_04820 [Bacteroidales bacterium]|nr:hypothetical protein [Bacteroidales bacterium]